MQILQHIAGNKEFSYYVTLQLLFFRTHKEEPHRLLCHLDASCEDVNRRELQALGILIYQCQMLMMSRSFTL